MWWGDCYSGGWYQMYCQFYLILFLEIFNEAIVHWPESLVFKEVGIFLPLHLRNIFALISQSLPICISEQNADLKLNVSVWYTQ